jgi:purine-nucleoside phosphorylase
MPTPHNTAEKGQIAKTVLMPGDPLRAKMVAETFLTDAVQFTAVRGMLGYTGTYNGKPVSVMGHGMGMPSVGIYSYELYTHYDVDNIIRVGSSGAYAAELKLFDVVLAESAWSESTYAHTMSGVKDTVTYPSEFLNEKLKASAKNQGLPITEGRIHSTDVFYVEPWQGESPPYWQAIREEQGCVAVEMESFALFHNARRLGKNAACVLTISDSFFTSKLTTVEERESGFTNMMKIALGVLELL